MIAAGWLDSLRAKHPDQPLYSYWDYKRNRWPRDAALRLDHLLLGNPLQKSLKDAGVDKWMRGEEGASDYAPAWITLSSRRK